MARSVAQLVASMRPRGSVRVDARGRMKTVKNLGWLLKNAAQVERFIVLEGPGFPNEAYLVAQLRDGRRYETPFASKEVLRDWLHRPSFRGLPLEWFGQMTEA